MDGPSKQSGKETVYQYCPFCGGGQWKFYVNSQTGKYICFHGACGAAGQSYSREGHSIVKDALGRFASTKTPEAQAVKLPPTQPLTDEAKAWLANRGILSPENYGFAEGLDGLAQRIVIPFCRPQGFQPIYWQARTYRDRKPKYFNAPATPRALYYLPAPASNTLVLVEGVFDAIAVRQLVPMDVAALLGTSLDITAGRMLLDIAPARVVVWLDRDALPKAIRLAAKLRGLLGVDVGMVFSTSSKDPADLCLQSPDQALDLLDQSMGHQVAL